MRGTVHVIYAKDSSIDEHGMMVVLRRGIVGVRVIMIRMAV